MNGKYLRLRGIWIYGDKWSLQVWCASVVSTRPCTLLPLRLILFKDCYTLLWRHVTIIPHATTMLIFIKLTTSGCVACGSGASGFAPINCCCSTWITIYLLSVRFVLLCKQVLCSKHLLCLDLIIDMVIHTCHNNWKWSLPEVLESSLAYDLPNSLH
jgi:hypothetical protein